MFLNVNMSLGDLNVVIFETLFTQFHSSHSSFEAVWKFVAFAKWRALVIQAVAAPLQLLVQLGDHELASGDWREGEVLFPL
jgi:hypothetical protein